MNRGHVLQNVGPDLHQNYLPLGELHMINMWYISDLVRGFEALFMHDSNEHELLLLMESHMLKGCPAFRLSHANT